MEHSSPKQEKAFAHLKTNLLLNYSRVLNHKEKVCISFSAPHQENKLQQHGSDHWLVGYPSLPKLNLSSAHNTINSLQCIIPQYKIPIALQNEQKLHTSYIDDLRYLSQVHLLEGQAPLTAFWHFHLQVQVCHPLSTDIPFQLQLEVPFQLCTHPAHLV